MSFDANSEPLSTYNDLLREQRFTEKELIGAGWFYFMKDMKSVTLPATCNGLSIKKVSEREAFHIHAPADGVNRNTAIDYIVGGGDLERWFFHQANAMWNKGHYRLPSDGGHIPL